jgi:hypothetical protein
MKRLPKTKKEEMAKKKKIVKKKTTSSLFSSYQRRSQSVGQKKTPLSVRRGGLPRSCTGG